MFAPRLLMTKGKSKNQALRDLFNPHLRNI